MITKPAHSDAFVTLLDNQLTSVNGGQEIPALGRCGPADRWRWLGDVYTPQCLAHDQAVRRNLDAGSSRFMAHVRALPQLPAAIGSYVRARATGETGQPPAN